MRCRQFAPAQEKSPADKAIRDYLTARANELEKDFLPDVKTGADLDKMRPLLRQQYFEMLDPLSALNIASSVAQFIEFGVNLFSYTNEIWNKGSKAKEQ